MSFLKTFQAFCPVLLHYTMLCCQSLISFPLLAYTNMMAYINNVHSLSTVFTADLEWTILPNHKNLSRRFNPRCLPLLTIFIFNLLSSLVTRYTSSTAYHLFYFNNSETSFWLFPHILTSLKQGYILQMITWQPNKNIYSFLVVCKICD